MNDQKKLESLAERLVMAAGDAGLSVAVAESCTGGMVAAAITDISGASAVLDRGLVTYSNAAKSDLLGVSKATLAAHGAVSMETAREMAAGTLANARDADLAVSITGIAGPNGGSDEKPVGLVHFGLARRDGGLQNWREVFPGDRAAIREQAACFALQCLINAIET